MNLETQSLGNKSPPERVVVYFYNSGGVDDFLLGTRDRIRTCKVCGKTIRRTMMHVPISGILPETDLEKYKKDPYNNMSPPIIYKD